MKSVFGKVRAGKKPLKYRIHFDHDNAEFCAAFALSDWMKWNQRNGRTAGQLMLYPDFLGRMGRLGPRRTITADICEMIQDWAGTILDAKVPRKYGSHSIKRSGITLMREKGVDSARILDVTKHTERNLLVTYTDDKQRAMTLQV